MADERRGHQPPPPPPQQTIHHIIHLAPDLQQMVQTYLQTSISQGAETMADLSALTAAVESQTTVVQSAVTLMSSLADELRNAADDPAAVQALADQLAANTDQLASAIAANTPGEETNPDDVPHVEHR